MFRGPTFELASYRYKRKTEDVSQKKKVKTEDNWIGLRLASSSFLKTEDLKHFINS